MDWIYRSVLFILRGHGDGVNRASVHGRGLQVCVCASGNDSGSTEVEQAREGLGLDIMK